MKGFYFTITLLAALAVISCKSDGNNEHKELTAEEKKVADSLSKIEQRRKSDSLKKINPLLIMPPDSNYTGDYIDKYPNGIVKYRGFFRFGKRHGQWMSFFPTGIIWSEMHYDKGLRHGPNIAYYENGKKRYEGFYKNDGRDSTWSYYDSTGVLLERLEFRNDGMVKKLPLK
jgi:antitoxin component YwqK of YwqJK toxin-antitoxin module